MSGSAGSDSFALVLEYSPDSHQFDIKVYGDICTVAPWAALAYAMSAVKLMAMEFPGLRSRAFLRCPRHGEEMPVTNTASRPGDKLLRDRGCRRCSRQTRDVGAAAVELVQMVDVLQARGVVFNKVNTDFAGLQHEYAALCPTKLGAHPEQVQPALESISKGVDDIRLTVVGIEGRLGGDEGGVLGGMAANIDSLAETVSGILKPDVDYLVTMVMALRGDQVDTPRQACILPGNYAEPGGLSDELRKPGVWMTKLNEWCESDYKAGKGVLKRDMRLFLVCAHTRQLVPCGYNGRGYDVSCTRKWVGKAASGVKVLLQVSLGTLAAVLLAQLPATIPGVALDQTAETACSRLQGWLDKLDVGDGDGKATGVQHEEVQALSGNAYEGLREVVKDVEEAARRKTRAAKKKARKARKRHRAPPTSSTSEFIYFAQVMTKVQARTGDGEAQWVLKEFKQAWLDAA